MELKNVPPINLSPSICEEALNRFSESDDSLTGLIEKNHIEVRDFMILSFVTDQKGLGIKQLSGALGLSMHTVYDCISRLVTAGLVTAEIDAAGAADKIEPTTSGKVLAKRILGP